MRAIRIIIDAILVSLAGLCFHGCERPTPLYGFETYVVPMYGVVPDLDSVETDATANRIVVDPVIQNPDNN